MVIDITDIPKEEVLVALYDYVPYHSDTFKSSRITDFNVTKAKPFIEDNCKIGRVYMKPIYTDIRYDTMDISEWLERGGNVEDLVKDLRIIR